MNRDFWWRHSHLKSLKCLLPLRHFSSWVTFVSVGFFCAVLHSCCCCCCYLDDSLTILLVVSWAYNMHSTYKQGFILMASFRLWMPRSVKHSLHIIRLWSFWPNKWFDSSMDSMQHLLTWNSLCNQVWPQIHDNSPALAFYIQLGFRFCIGCGEVVELPGWLDRTLPLAVMSCPGLYLSRPSSDFWWGRKLL